MDKILEWGWPRYRTVLPRRGAIDYRAERENELS